MGVNPGKSHYDKLLIITANILILRLGVFEWRVDMCDHPQWHAPQVGIYSRKSFSRGS